MSDVRTLEGAVWEALDGVQDPEIPAVSVVDMGMVREVGVEGSRRTGRDASHLHRVSGGPGHQERRRSRGRASGRRHGSTRSTSHSLRRGRRTA